jgi:hypothetical protein
MTSFRNVALGEFLREVKSISFNPTLQKAWANLDYDMIFQGPDGDTSLCAICDGDLHLGEDFDAPAFHVLVRGSLVVDGVIDTNFTDMDEGGSFIVSGNVRCMVFLNHYGKSGVIGGDLVAREMLVNGFEDSLLYVGGAITTHFFYGWDVWAEFGARAELEYGIGYCLPLNYSNAAVQAIRPRFDEAASYRRLALPLDDERANEEIVAHVRSGRPLFR